MVLIVGVSILYAAIDGAITRFRGSRSPTLGLVSQAKMCGPRYALTMRSCNAYTNHTHDDITGDVTVVRPAPLISTDT